MPGEPTLLARLKTQKKDNIDLKALFKDHPTLKAQVIKVDERADSRDKSCLWITLRFELAGKQVAQEFKYSASHFAELVERMGVLGWNDIPLLSTGDWEAVSFTIGYPRYMPVVPKKTKP